MSPLIALLVEAWGTLILAFVIFALTHERNTVGLDGGTPLMIGFTVSVLISLYAPITQAGWNPARDFAPRLVAYFAGWGSIAIPGPRGGFWVYIVGPCLGAPVGTHYIWVPPVAVNSLCNPCCGPLSNLLGAWLAEKVLWGDILSDKEVAPQPQEGQKGQEGKEGGEGGAP